ncbi:hypothetical protein JS80_09790 [Anoxybacillus sp. KU2-6(11)]|nr:hypothetical protein JS80_09790 [Anoxybacillus sp. KU2-6(11)]
MKVSEYVMEPSYNFGNMARKSLPNNRKLLDYEGKDLIGFFHPRAKYVQNDAFPYDRGASFWIFSE